MKEIPQRRTYKEKNGNFESQMNDGECDCDGSQCQSQCCIFGLFDRSANLTHAVDEDAATPEHG